MYRVSILLCLTAAASSSVYLGAQGSIGLGLFQCLVFATIAGFAWICRDHRAGSAVVVLMAVLAIALSGAVIHLDSQARDKGASFLQLAGLAGQAIVALWGCYVGYAFVEHSRSQNTARSAQGKFVVVGLLVLVAAAVGGKFIFVVLLILVAVAVGWFFIAGRQF